MPYQVVIFGGGENAQDAATVRQRVRSTLDSRVSDLGLQPNVDLTYPTTTTWDPRQPLAALYLGGAHPTAEDDSPAARLLAAGAFVLPLVPTLASYSSNVPASLHPVNGLERMAADPNFEHAVARILEELGLLRGRRLVFISYKRSESRGVAQQLFRALDARSFDVFLDTRSVQAGIQFQGVLWDRMADADVVILLDTATALKSEWVDKEVSRANEMGIGALQLVWPEKERAAGTEFAQALYLTKKDINGDPGSDASELTAGKLTEVVAEVESVRARSFAARRTRVVTEFQKHAHERGLTAHLTDRDMMELSHPKYGQVRLFPIVGKPGSLHMQRAFERAQSAATKDVRLLLYDPLGFLPETLNHLHWLRKYLPTGALATTEARTWMLQ